MMVSISPEEFRLQADALLANVGKDIFVVEREGQVLGVLVSGEEFQEIRAARGQRAIAAMNRMSDAIEASGATESELLALEKALDRKA